MRAIRHYFLVYHSHDTEKVPLIPIDCAFVFQLHISVAVFGVGSGSMTLPTRVKVPFRGLNITVLIPKGVRITLKKQGRN